LKAKEKERRDYEGQSMRMSISAGRDYFTFDVHISREFDVGGGSQSVLLTAKKEGG